MVDSEAIGTGLITQQNSKFLDWTSLRFKDRCMGHVLMARPVHHKTTRGDGGMADTPVLGTGVARREGSSPFRPTTHRGQLAQLVEHLVDIEGVRGSSPLPPTTQMPS